jgi:quinol monooxygenase YgiN
VYVRIGTFEVPPQQLDAVIAFFSTRAAADFSTHEGFLGYIGYVDRARGRFVGISQWSSLAALEASGDTAAGILRDAAALGAVIVGERQILELAFDSRAATPGEPAG